MKHKPQKQPKFSLGIVDKASQSGEKQLAKPKSSTKTSKLVKTIDKTIDDAIARMTKLNQTVQQKKQQMNVDLFLQKQKEKRMEYAKNLNEEFEKQRKLREKKIYKQPVKQPENQKRYINEMPDIRKEIDRDENSPKSIIDSHVTSIIKKGVDSLNTEELRVEEENLFKSFTGKADICWERVEKLAEDTNKIHFAENDKKGYVEIKGDLFPGELAEDLINVFVLIARAPKLYRYLVLNSQLQQGNPNAKSYCILRMFINRLPTTIVTDWSLQCETYDQNQIIKYSHCNNKNRFWIPILEKAYKKMKYIDQKQLAQLSFTNILNDIVNMDAEIIKFSKEALLLPNFFMAINLLIKNGTYLFFQRKGFINNNSATFEDRFYPIKQVKLSTQNKRISIINPWKNKIVKTDGLDQLSISDILANFNRIIVIKSYPSTWTGISFESSFFSYGLPASGNTEWTKNNQHSFMIKKGSYVRIFMKPQQIQKDQYGYLLFRAEQHDVKIQSMNLQRLIANAKSSNANQANMVLFLEKGNYFIVPYTHTKSYDSYVFFRFEVYYSDKGLIIGKTKYNDVKYENISKQQDKIIAELVETERFQQPKTELILSPDEKNSRLIPDTITIADLASMGIKHQKPEGNLQQFFIPGLFNSFIVKDSIIVQQKQSKKNKTSQPLEQSRLYEQNNEILKYLLGADAYTEQVNVGLMNEAMQMLDQNIDFAMYEIGDEGLQPLIQVIMEVPKIRSLNISSNLLTDKSIVYLCYYLEKTNHSELRQINVSNNDISEVGYHSLVGLSQRFPVLKSIKADGNPKLTRQQIKKLSRIKQKE